MGKNLAKVTTTFQFCDGGSCKKANSDIALREARAYLRNEDLWDDTHTIRTRCNGRCEDAPTLIVQPGNYWYKNIDAEKTVAIVKSHIVEKEPIPDFLLFTNGWNSIKSDNNKTPVPSIFKLKEDPEFGENLVCRSSASDQYLYPLFKKIFENPNKLELSFNETLFQITNPHKVIYTDAFDMIVSGDDIQFTIAVGPITKVMEKDVSREIIDRKVGVAEVVWLKDHKSYLGSIRLKNRKGKHLITINISNKDETLWNYIFKIYLQMDINNPRILSEVD